MLTCLSVTQSSSYGKLELGTGTKSSRDAIYFLVTLVVGKNAEPLLGKAGLVLKRISLHGTFGQNFQEQIADETTTSSSFSVSSKKDEMCFKREIVFDVVLLLMLLCRILV